MPRRLLGIAVLALVAAQTGCQSSRCGGPGWFTSRHKEAPCQTVGQKTGCYDAITGQPVPCPPEGGATLVPGGGAPYPILPGGAYPRPNELHMPGPTELIPRPAVPVPAPGDASLPYPASPGVPVKGK